MMNKIQLRFKILSSRFIGPLIIAVGYPHYSSFKSDRWGGTTFDEEMERCINLYGKEHVKRNGLFRLFIKIEIIWCYYKYTSTPKEFFLFDFPNCSGKRRAQFLTTKHKDDVMRSKVGFGENWQLLKNKYKFYIKFKDFFKRDVLLVNEQLIPSEMSNFCKKHNSFIVKPLDGQSGKGITKLSVKNDVDINELLNELKNLYNICLLEEIIKQDESMSSLNASSVNSVRLPTFLNKEGFHVLKPFIRIGREGSVVDNTGAGGIFACIDEKTGILTTEGMCETDGCLYKVHPDSKHQILGWQIPHWNDLLFLAEKIHRTIPSYPYVGWDFALTKTGWVLIEGNWGQFTTEYLDKEGVKEKFDAMFD